MTGEGGCTSRPPNSMFLSSSCSSSARMRSRSAGSRMSSSEKASHAGRAVHPLSHFEPHW